MNKFINPPSPQLKREYIFSVRLTSVESKAIKQLAKQMNVSPSHLARHFLMQAIDYYSKTMKEAVPIETGAKQEHRNN